MLELDPVEFELRDHLKTRCAFSASGPTRRARAEFPRSSRVPDQLIGDAARLRQVLVNLVGNAIKFTERAGSRRCRSECGNAGKCGAGLRFRVGLHFSVTDTGIGIPADKRESIFAPFTQVDGSTTRLYGGTGLGLSISSQLVHLMGGRLWVESEVGQGSTFHFTAYVAQRDRLRSAEETSPQQRRDGAGVQVVAALGTTSRADRNPGRSLCLYGSPWHGPFASCWLKITRSINGSPVSCSRKLGHVVTFAANGREAIAALARQSFDLVMMDLQMPVMDGFEATAAIRSAEQGTPRHIPIIALTAHAMKEDRQRCLEAGMDGYVSKPIQRDELRQAIEDCMLLFRETVPDEPPDVNQKSPLQKSAVNRLNAHHDLFWAGLTALRA